VKNLAKKKSRKNRKHNSFVSAWDNTYSLDSSNALTTTYYGYNDFCDSKDVNKIALDVFGALSVSVSDLV
jgi:hypothetical protein